MCQNLTLFVLKKNLCVKDEIIKKLVDNQSTFIIDTISVKSNDQHSNTVNQANFSLPSNNFFEHS